MNARMMGAVGLAAGLVFLAGSLSLGGETTWQGTPGVPGNWLAAENWIAGVPGSATTAEVNNGGAVTVSAGSATCDMLRLGSLSGTSGSLTLTGNGQLSAREVRVGRYGSGTMTQDGGSISLTDQLVVGSPGAGQYYHSAGVAEMVQLYVGRESGASGTYVLSGTGRVSASWQFIGPNGNGTFIQTGGTNVGNGMRVGSGTGTGRYELSQTGVLSLSQYLAIGEYGVGTFVQTGGENRTAWLQLGYYREGRGIYELSGAGFLSASEERIGYNLGPGSFTQTGGTHVAGNLQVGCSQYCGGAFDISGGTLSATQLYVGFSESNSTFTVRGGGAGISAGSFTQERNATLFSVVEADGLTKLAVTGAATLGGTWTIQDTEAPVGRFDVLSAHDGISGNFAEVNLPGPDWSWGIQDGTTLWVRHIPEPTSMALLVLGGLAMFRQRRRPRRCGRRSGGFRRRCGGRSC